MSDVCKITILKQRIPTYEAAREYKRKRLASKTTRYTYDDILIGHEDRRKRGAWYVFVIDMEVPPDGPVCAECDERFDARDEPQYLCQNCR